MQTSALQLERLQGARTIDDVLDNLDRVIEWSIRQGSTIGYFAVLYRRATLAVREAVIEGRFDNPSRMEQFDVISAQRYFNALNAYFYPGEYDGLTLAWEVSFVGHMDSQSTMLQHMMTGLNAHICFDLGVAAAAIAPDSLDRLEHDFNLINALVASQVRGMLKVVEKLSPEVRSIRRFVPNEVWLIRRLLIKFRTAAWLFAIGLAQQPNNAREQTVHHACWTAALGAWYLQPPPMLALLPLVVRTIVKRESRDVAENLRALADIKDEPEKRHRAFL